MQVHLSPEGIIMFCYQCEQTSKGEGCQTIGVCGKDEATATMQDLLIHAVKGISMYAHRARLLGAADPEIDAFTIQAIFATLTNVNFDPERLAELVRQAAVTRDAARALYVKAIVAAGQTPVELGGPAAFQPAPSMEGLLAQGRESLLPTRFLTEGKEIANLRELVMYGIKGAAAYAAHALALGAGSPATFAQIHEVMNFLAESDHTSEEYLGKALAVGELNYKVMESLDAAHNETFGTPEPAPVRLGALKGKAILVSGHDLHDLHALLEQTEGLGINIYTHGEMLPAHGYPKLKAYKHLAGNYGGPWVDQAGDFEHFPGAILMTSNCIQEPRSAYKSRIFTCGPVAWPGVQHIADQDFAPLIAAALKSPGFAYEGDDQQITVGFGHKAILSVAPQVIDAVKTGVLRRFFVVGGCDGARSGRSYYTELAEKIPQDCIILTLGCGKFRFNKMELGTLGGLPRLLDLGQCNDTYSAIQVALALANVFECGVNDLPLSIILSWYEQKAVAVLLTLLFLGVKNIRIGPTLPAFISPGVLGILQEKFNLMPITTAAQDLSAIFAA
jgi:hydroxylamine reductase